MKNPWDDIDETLVADKNETPQTKTQSKGSPQDPTIRTSIQKLKNPSLTDKKHVSAEVKEVMDDTLRKFSNKLGEILMQVNPKLTRKLIDETMSQSIEKSSNDMIGEALFKKKLITEDELLKALSLQSGIQITGKINEDDIPYEFTQKVPIAFAKKHTILPYKKEGNTILVAMSNPSDMSIIDDLRIFLQSNIRPTLAKKNDILNYINLAYDPTSKINLDEHDDDLLDHLDEQDLSNVQFTETQDLLDSDDEAPIIRLVNTLLFRAVKDRASDIHIEPFETDISVRFRIDGILYEIMRPPKKAQASILSRIKIMSDLDIAEKRIPQDGRIKIKLGGKTIDIRVSTLPTSHGERVVMRILDTSHIILNLEDLGFDTKQLALIKKITQLSHGIFLVTGPTGSGKTSTLYASLSSINSKDVNIITVEDPVEIQLQGIGQIQVNPKVNLTFASGLRSILRQDPDVIMVGEIRDLETAEIAIQASLTGHLVFSTIHTNDAAGSVTRLVDMGVEPFLVASSLVAAMAQRLVRRLCKTCREPYMPSIQELQEINLTPEHVKKYQVYKAKGCPECTNTGYQGRMGIYEIMPIDETIRSMIIKNTDSGTIKKAASVAGVKSLREDGANKVLQGLTTIEEILRVTQDDMLV